MTVVRPAARAGNPLPGLGRLASCIRSPLSGTADVAGRRGLIDVLNVPLERFESERNPMITVSDLELRAGVRLLLGNTSFQVASGDKIGLVGRNGAGKTTMLRVLAGEVQ